MRTKINFKLIFMVMLLGIVSSMGCGNDSDGNDEGNILFADENNYSFTGTLDIPVIETACAENILDIVIDWSKLTTDLQYHDMNPAIDIDNVMLVRIQDLTEDQVEEQLSTGELKQSYLDGYLNVVNENDETSANMGDMTLLGSPPPDMETQYVEDERVYLLLLASGLEPGVGARMLVFLHPRNDSTNKLIEIEPWPILDFSANLTSLTPVDIPVDGPWVVDWSNLTINGQGNEMVFENIDGVMLGFYEGETVETLESQVLDLELIADELYKIELLSGGRTFDIAELEQEGFSGFTSGGTWIFGLTCSMCQNPAPLFLTVLNPA